MRDNNFMNKASLSEAVPEYYDFLHHNAHNIVPFPYSYIKKASSRINYREKNKKL